MAKPLVLDRRETRVDEHERIIDYYREALARKPELPEWEYPPTIIGPTWQLTPNGYWLLPERSLAWDAFGWCGTWLQHSRDDPWRFTLEQARFLLWWYAIDEAGNFLYRDGVLQRLKGWGKDPLGACICALELLGPCRFLEFWHGDEVVATDMPDAWVQTAAVSLEQTKNTMRLFPRLFSDVAKHEFDLQVGKETIYALGGKRFMQAHTSSPTTMEGNRITFVLLNEIWLFFHANMGHEMWETIRGNAAKAPDGATRTLGITNAYRPGQDSVAERRRTTWEKMASSQALTEGLLYDSLEAHPDAPLTAEAAPLVVPSIRGDSVWLKPSSIVKEILDIDNPPSESRRKWYNQITATEDSWTTPQAWDACPKALTPLTEGDQIVLFLDTSKSDDTTCLDAVRVSDGAGFLLKAWARPEHIREWIVPREDADNEVRRAFALYDVVAFFGDPMPAEDETGSRYWDALFDGWARDFGGDGPSPERLCIWATESGAGRHAVMWPMTISGHLKMFTEACERTLADIEARALIHDGNLITRMHVMNARRRPNPYGISIGKESRGSAKKIDAAVTRIGARMLWRMYLALPESKKRKPAGWHGITI